MNLPSAAPSTVPRPSKGRPRAFDRSEALERALDVFWRLGYEPATIAELCTAMGINPPSLYAAFGNKAKLFLEAVDFYDRKYWDAARVALEEEADVYPGIESFFADAAAILLSPRAPCGCLVVLAAINVSPESTEVYEAVRSMRRAGKTFFAQRLQRGVEDGQLPASTDIAVLAATLKAMLEGMSIQARDGIGQAELAGVAAHVIKLLPPRSTQHP